MKTIKEIKGLLACRIGWDNNRSVVISYIRINNGRKVYGYWDYKETKYKEET